MRVYFYQFPVESVYAFKDYPILRNTLDHAILFHVVNVETDLFSQEDLHYMVNNTLYKSKDIKTLAAINSKFHVVSNLNVFNIQRWNSFCLVGKSSKTCKNR